MADIDTFIFKSGFSRRQVKGFLKTQKGQHRKFTEKNVKRAIRGLVKRKALRKDVFGRDVTVSAPAVHRQIVYGRARVGGVFTFIHTSANHAHLMLVITLTTHQIAEVEKLFLNDEEVTFGTAFTSSGTGATATGKYANKVYMQVNLGETTQVALSQLVTDSGGAWTSTDRQLGCAHVYLKLTWSNKLFSNGIPDIHFQIKGKVLANTGETGFGAGWSQNAAHCLFDFLRDRTYGGRVEFGASTYAIYFGGQGDYTAALTTCNEDVALAAGGTEKRYTVNGVWTTQDSRRGVIEDMLSAMAGYLIEDGPQGWGYMMVAGKYRTPHATLTITEDDVIGPLVHDGVLPADDYCDKVRGTFVNPTNNYEESEFPAYNALGGNIAENLSLPATTSVTTAQRLAKIFKKRTVDYPLQVVLPVKLKFLELYPGDTIKVTLARFGWTEKVFEVESTQFFFTTDGNEGHFWGVRLKLRETDSSIYAWTTAEETATSAPPTPSLPKFDTTASTNPTGLTLESGGANLYVMNDGTIITRIKASWTSPVDSYVTEGGRIEVQFKKSADSEWIDSTPVPGSQSFAYIFNVQDGVSYDVRVRSITAVGTPADYVTATGHVVQGKTAPPSNVTSLTGRVEGTNVTLEWTAVADKDLKFYRLKYTASNQSWANATKITDTPDLSYVHTVNIQSGFKYMVKAVDTSGNESATEASWTYSTATPGAGVAMGVLGLTYSS